MRIPMVKMEKLGLLSLFILIFTGSLSSFARTDSFISNEEALKRALEYAKVGPEYAPQEPRLAYDRQGRPWYTVDFLRIDEATQKTFLGKKVVLDPYQGIPVADPEILREMKARISFEEAVTRASEQIQLGKEYKFQDSRLSYSEVDNSFWYELYLLGYDRTQQKWVPAKQITASFVNDSLARVWYQVNSLKVDPQTRKTFWEKRIVIEPSTGEIVTDEEILKEMAAREGDIPPGVDPKTKEIMSGGASSWKTFGLIPGLFILGLVLVGAIVWRARVAQWRKTDYVFAFAALLQGILALALYQTDRFLGVFLLTSAIGTVTYWVATRASLGHEIDRGSNFTLIPPAKLPKFADVGGMEEIKRELKNTVGLMVDRGELAQRYRVEFNGILLFGPPGVGKTYLAKATAGEFGLNFLRVKVSELVDMYMGSSAKRIQLAFQTARKKSPCLLLFDDFESIAGERGVMSPQVEDTRIVNQLLHCLEEVRSHPGKVVVFAAANSKDDLDEAVIRPGRFDKHIYIPLPDEKARHAILETHLKGKPRDRNLSLGELAQKTEGMSAAEIEAVVDQAMIQVLSRSGRRKNPDRLSLSELISALENLRGKQKPVVKKLSWSDLILQEEVFQELKRFVKVIENPDGIRKLGIEPPKGVLLYGPPGTGKTTVAKVIANEANASFFSISQADIYSKWLGESERNVKKIFDEARRYKPSIIFIDEVDALMTTRGSESGYWADKVVSQILQEIDGMEDLSHVFIIGATNKPDAVDPALLRGGRLSAQIEIPLPGQLEREKLFAVFLKNVEKAPDVDLAELATETNGYSGADIREICHRAILGTAPDFKGPAQPVKQQALFTALGQYKKIASIYEVPASFKKGKLGF